VSELRRSRYVERVREATRALFEDLLEQNRRLCLSLALLGQGRESAPPDLGEMDRFRAEQQSLLELLEAADRETRGFEEQVADVERQNSNLATLYAAGHALHASL